MVAKMELLIREAAKRKPDVAELKKAQRKVGEDELGVEVVVASLKEFMKLG